MWVFDVEHPAIVLGSGQPDSDVDADAAYAAGVDVVRRRSGGGAVLLVPGDVVWIDVLLPATDPLWSDDVRLAFHWLGEAWAEALGRLGVAADVHRGAMVPSPWSSRACFAGLGPGEVVAATPGRPKLVGLSQRRTRHGARLQSSVHRRFSAAPTVDLLAMTAADRTAARAELDVAVAAVDATTAAIADAFLASLPS